MDDLTERLGGWKRSIHLLSITFPRRKRKGRRRQDTPFLPRAEKTRIQRETGLFYRKDKRERKKKSQFLRFLLMFYRYIIYIFCNIK